MPGARVAPMMAIFSAWPAVDTLPSRKWKMPPPGVSSADDAQKHPEWAAVICSGIPAFWVGTAVAATIRDGRATRGWHLRARVKDAGRGS
jgi:hypothetical protein